ncbi:8-oxoguanine DNA glycosylase OGG fold protein [Streptomyces sp. NPDC002787]
MRRLLPDSAVEALGGWLAGPGAAYAVGGVGTHAVDYVPAYWSGVEPWPDRLLDRARTEASPVSRDDVTAATREAVERGEWAEALVASYVWGQGRTGYGPHRLKEILAESAVKATLATAGAGLREEGPVAAYRSLRGAVKGLGPAFFTKFLYFLDRATDGPTAPGPRALILDQRVARVLRAYATRVGSEMGMASAADIAAWIWSDNGWTSHRYDVYLRWMTATAGQLARSGINWPEPGGPDLLELALFNGVWQPASV